MVPDTKSVFVGWTTLKLGVLNSVVPFNKGLNVWIRVPEQLGTDVSQNTHV